MKLKLYILVDKDKRICYTSDNRKQVQYFKKSIEANNKNLKIVKLTGEIKWPNTPYQKSPSILF